ncbi:DUF2784 domain-containing protein [Nitrincola alkalilacustris]|uniref:DUF2784 domain-containing protein n=1 Tax=Nitrincola alkalilacustris TaxID=1571224 RepID=UPI00124CEDEA|nr:DUF2784 domain-containing protein [Nitrincola alkalilacustris]
MSWYDRVPAPGLVADIILILHSLIVVFVIFGLVLTLLGGWLNWQWVRNIWFRSIHLLTILIVAAQAWFGMICPLTIWEQELRRVAGQFYYDISFIEYWLGQLLYYDLPWWVFVLIYSLFGVLVAMTFWLVPPRWRKH